MTKTTTVCLAAIVALSVSGTAASACNLHGPGQFNGFHRYNPFSTEVQNVPPPPPLSKAVKTDETDEKAVKIAKSEGKLKEDEKRQKTLEQSLSQIEEQAKADASQIR